MNYSQIEKNAKNRKRLMSVVTYILLALWAIVVLFPFYYMILTSVKSYSAYNSEYIPKLYTLTPTIQNYVDAFTAVPLAKYFANTVLFTLVTHNIMFK